MKTPDRQGSWRLRSPIQKVRSFLKGWFTVWNKTDKLRSEMYWFMNWLPCCFFVCFCSSFPGNYWDKFVKRKVKAYVAIKTIARFSLLLIVSLIISYLPLLYLQVLDKYGDIYGRERIAELLGMDLASLEITSQNGKKPEPDKSMLAWCVYLWNYAYNIFNHFFPLFFIPA